MITPIVRHGLDCLQNCVTTILGVYTDCYPMCFCQSWNFTYQKTHTDVLGKRISNGGLNIVPNAKRLFGAMVEQDSDDHFDRFCERLEECVRLHRMPMLFLDSFFCPWYPVYRKLHREHYCIVTGLTEEGDYLCLDPILGKSDAVLLKTELQNCFDHFIVVTLPEQTAANCSIPFLYDLVIEGVGQYIKTDCAQQIKTFAADFYESFDYGKEFRDLETYFFDVELFKQLTYIAGGRELYAEYLRFLADRHPDPALACYARRLEEIASRWHVIKGMLTKSYYAHFDDEIKGRIFTQLMKIEREEDLLSHEMFESLQQRERRHYAFD